MTQGSATGTLKTELTGVGTVTVVVECATDVVFDTLGAVTINSGTPIADTAVTAAAHSGATTTITVTAASGTVFLAGTTNLLISHNILPESPTIFPPISLFRFLSQSYPLMAACDTFPLYLP